MRHGWDDAVQYGDGYKPAFSGTLLLCCGAT